MVESYNESGPLISAKQICQRYKIVTRTLGRWLENETLNFPKPVVINGRRYFREKRLEEWERRRAAINSSEVA